MYVGYYQKNSEGVVEHIYSSSHDTREEAHTAAVALADSLVSNSNVIEVVRGYQVSDTEYRPRVAYNVPPTDAQRNPS
jgi:hypothetical protein